MQFRFSAAALVVALSFTAPVQAAGQWQFITSADDDTLYFGRNIRHHSGLTFVEVKTEGAPEGGNGAKNAWTQPLNCSAKTYMDNRKKWHAANSGTVAEDWLEYACKGRTSLSDYRSLGA